MEINGSNSLKATILYPTFSSKTTEPAQIDQLLAKHPTKLEQGIKTFYIFLPYQMEHQRPHVTKSRGRFIHCREKIKHVPWVNMA